MKYSANALVILNILFNAMFAFQRTTDCARGARVRRGRRRAAARAASRGAEGAAGAARGAADAAHERHVRGPCNDAKKRHFFDLDPMPDGCVFYIQK